VTPFVCARYDIHLRVGLDRHHDIAGSPTFLCWTSRSASAITAEDLSKQEASR